MQRDSARNYVGVLTLARKITCNNCQKYLGEIRDARLLKSIVYLCASCNDSITRKNDFSDLFKGFGSEIKNFK